VTEGVACGAYGEKQKCIEGPVGERGHVQDLGVEGGMRLMWI